MDAKLGKDEVRRAYRRYAPTYDLWSGFAESRARERCLEVADIRDGEAVLEVAVGTGVLFEKILRLNPSGRNEGMDLTEEMLDRARERARRSGAEGYVLKVGDAYHLGYPDETFDLVINSYMLDLIPEEDFAVILGEFKRVLRRGGRVVIVSMTKGSRWFNALWGWIYRRRPSFLGGCRQVELAPHVEAAGFVKVRREQVSQMGFPSEVVSGVKP